MNPQEQQEVNEVLKRWAMDRDHNLAVRALRQLRNEHKAKRLTPTSEPKP